MSPKLIEDPKVPKNTDQVKVVFPKLKFQSSDNTSEEEYKISVPKETLKMVKNEYKG